MGRDKPKKYNKMGYFQKQSYYEDQGKKYNINRESFENAAGGGGGRYEDFDHDGFRDAVKNAQRNDFDYRTSASHMDGIKGDGSSADFVNYQRGAQKLHKQAGNGGEYSSNEDITTVTNNLVNDYRDSFSDQFATKEDLNKQQDVQKAQSQASTEPVELSARAKAANDLGDYSFNATEQRGLGKSDLAYDPNAGVKSDKAGSFMNGYKGDIMKGIGKDGTPGRGPNSIHNKF
jgi:hypothetical protein